MSYPSITPTIQRDVLEKFEFVNLENKEGLYRHQEFVRRYLSPHTPYKGLLVFHSLGSGKSLICISVALDHYLHDGKKCLIVTKGGSGTDNFKKEISMYYTKSGCKLGRKEYRRIFTMVHYMALHNTICTLSDEDIKERYKNMILVFDEIHNVRRMKTTNGDKTKMYDSLQKIIKLADNTKVIMATATPMTNDTEQLMSTISLLSPTGDYQGIVSYNAEIEHKPHKVFHGEEGYLDGMKVYLSRMQSHQKRYHREEEDQGSPKDIYRMLTHVSLFAFPKFAEYEGASYGRDIYKSGIMEQERHTKIITSVTNGEEKSVTHNFYRVIEQYRQWLKGKKLRKCSSKYAALMDLLEDESLDNGPVFVFVEEVRGSGLLLLANILEEHGYELYLGEHPDTIPKKKRYTFCVGDESVVSNKSERLDGFNSDANKYGKYVRVLIGSKVIGESITLKNVRMFHIMTIHWNDSTIEQAIGRVIRSGSHEGLEPEERKVDIYVHAAIYGKDRGTDIYKLQICNKKQKKISRKEKELKESAVDKYIIQKPQTKGVGKDVSTFVLHYIDTYNEILIDKLFSVMDGKKSISLEKVLEEMEMDPIIAKEVMYHVITHNIPLPNGKYLREGYNKIFSTTDPSTPFRFIHKESPKLETEIVSIKPAIMDLEHISHDMDSVMELDNPYTVRVTKMLVDIPFTKRIAFVEKYVSMTGTIPDVFRGHFTKYKGKIYNILAYRIPGDAYIAVIPIPKPNVLQCKMRVMMDDSSWEYLEDPELEIVVNERLQTKYDRMMRKIDDKEDTFLIISLIDNKSRIRTRILEKTTKGNTDKRYIRKGRCLSSILKGEIGMLYIHIIGGDIAKVTKELRNKYTNIKTLDNAINVYGYSSMENFYKKDRDMFGKFVDVMENNSSRDIIAKIEKYMVVNAKYIFL